MVAACSWRVASSSFSLSPHCLYTAPTTKGTARKLSFSHKSREDLRSTVGLHNATNDSLIRTNSLYLDPAKSA